MNSIILFGCLVWQQVLRYKSYSNLILGVQRKAILKIVGEYRTIFTVTEIPPKTLAEERQRFQMTKNAHQKSIKVREREHTLNQWQQLEENMEMA